MYLKSLTLKGFKSFASATTLQLEPGITCIVGPNGSGKSNVVDALAWVMGEQGAKSLRGGKMEDVIFAGTSGRPPLGRAEVQLTIDNTDGALPIDYAEVTISRTMFRNGGSEYAINGTKARLIDVQDLLSDSGIGREMHVIVGQGQLDSILHATPEDRRGFIEEAAGVLKHRKRKEKALRKLSSMQGNLDRLNDLISEIRRQLKPLGRQAEVARRAQGVQADVRDARARIAADDLVTARTALEQEMADESVLLARRAEVEAELAQVRAAESALEAALREDLPALAAAQETWFALSGLRERFRGTRSLALERLRNAATLAEEPMHTGRDPERLEADAARMRADEAQIAAEVEALRTSLEEAVSTRRAGEDAAAEEDRRVLAAQRAAADRREGLARLSGQVDSMRSRVESSDDEIGRLEAARAEADARAEQAQKEFTALETQVAGLDAGEEGLDAEHEEASASLDEVEAELAGLRGQLATAERDRTALAARRDALAMGLDRKDGAGALAAADVPGLLGSLASLLGVRTGHETAVAAALGQAADAVVVADLAAAVMAVEHLKRHDLGRAGIVVGGDPDRTRAAAPAELPEDVASLPGTCWALDQVESPVHLAEAVGQLLTDVVLVPDLGVARAVVTAHPDLRAVTAEGDVLGVHAVRGGSGAQPSLLETQAAHDEAVADLAEATTRAERLGFAISGLEARRLDALKRVDVALARLHESDAHLAAVAEELAQLGSAARSARAEAERLDQAITAAAAAKETSRHALEELESRLSHAEEAPAEEVDTSAREALAQAARDARQAEMDARLALRTAEERARAINGRADALLRQAKAERDHRATAQERRNRLVREGRAAEAVQHASEVVLHLLEGSVNEAAEARSQIERSRHDREQRLLSTRARLRDLGRELDELVNSAHRDELARAQQQMRIQQMEERAVEDLGIAPDVLVAEYGPDQPVPSTDEAPEGVEPPAPRPYVRAEQEKRLRAAERALAQLGRINPLALEEFAAMEERHQFLTAQLEDLRQTRKDLLDIVKEVDARVEQVFTEAYADVEKAFDHTFSRLFPGGEGRLVLTDPSDMLTTGIEVEARPPGKKVKRLSLLSGGERSLVAVAFLVALFKARPSPFYILDEVEAALDDTNLGRLLQIYEELRENSQLLVITHQKRTMEVGDALYGVTMRGDGVSTVISQRLRETEPA